MNGRTWKIMDIDRDIEQRFTRLLRIDPLIAAWFSRGMPGDYKELVVLLGERAQDHMKALCRKSLYENPKFLIAPCPKCGDAIGT
jgi:hypothetical protein